jgi:glycerol-3-phosphate responsive antiterminator
MVRVTNNTKISVFRALSEAQTAKQGLFSVKNAQLSTTLKTAFSAVSRQFMVKSAGFWLSDDFVSSV